MADGDAKAKPAAEARRPRPSPKASRSSSPACSPPPSSRSWCSDILRGAAKPRIEHALAMILEIEKTVIEGAAAAGLRRRAGQSRPVSGPQGRHRDVGRQYRHAAAVQRDPARTDAGRPHPDSGSGDRGPARRWRGSPASVGDAGGNILEVSHNRMMTGISAKSATLGWWSRRAMPRMRRKSGDRLAGRAAFRPGLARVRNALRLRAPVFAVNLCR